MPRPDRPDRMSAKNKAGYSFFTITRSFAGPTLPPRWQIADRSNPSRDRPRPSYTADRHGAHRRGRWRPPAANPIHGCAVPQVLDAGAAPIQEIREWPRLWRKVESHADDVHELLEWHAAMRCGEGHDIGYAVDPLVVRRASLLAGTSDDQTTHGMADKRD